MVFTWDFLWQSLGHSIGLHAGRFDDRGARQIFKDWPPANINPNSKKLASYSHTGLKLTEPNPTIYIAFHTEIWIPLPATTSFNSCDFTYRRWAVVENNPLLLEQNNISVLPGLVHIHKWWRPVVSSHVWVHMCERGLIAALFWWWCLFTSTLRRQNCWRSDTANLLLPANQINIPPTSGVACKYYDQYSAQDATRAWTTPCRIINTTVQPTPNS